MLSFFLFVLCGYCFVVSWVFAALLLLANLGYFRTLLVNFMTFFVSNVDKLSEMRRNKGLNYIF